MTVLNETSTEAIKSVAPVKTQKNKTQLMTNENEFANILDFANKSFALSTGKSGVLSFFDSKESNVSDYTKQVADNYSKQNLSDKDDKKTDKSFSFKDDFSSENNNSCKKTDDAHKKSSDHLNSSLYVNGEGYNNVVYQAHSSKPEKTDITDNEHKKTISLKNKNNVEEHHSKEDLKEKISLLNNNNEIIKAHSNKYQEVKAELKEPVIQETKGNTKPLVKADVKPDVKAEVKADVKPEAKTDVKPEVLDKNIETKSEIKEDIKSNGKNTVLSTNKPNNIEENLKDNQKQEKEIKVEKDAKISVSVNNASKEAETQINKLDKPIQANNQQIRQAQPKIIENHEDVKSMMARMELQNVSKETANSGKNGTNLGNSSSRQMDKTLNINITQGAGNKTEFSTVLKAEKIIPQKPVDPQNILKQVNDKIKAELKQDNKELTISLKPDKLGKVDIKLVNQNGVLTAQINTENQQIKDIINKGIEALRQNLTEQGLNVGKILVQAPEPPQNSNNNNFSQQFNHQQNSTSFEQSNSNQNNPSSQNSKNSTDSFIRGQIEEELNAETIEKDSSVTQNHKGLVDYTI